MFASPPCPTHPNEVARDACTRCGSYACDHCMVSGSRSEFLCTSCDARIAAHSSAPVQRPAFVLRIALGVCAVSAVASSLGTLAGLTDEHPVMLISGGLFALSFLASAITWCIWFRRANRALTARAMQLEFGPNAWGWFVVPIAHWFKPYQSLVELYTRATDRLVAPPFVLAWWLLWVLGNLVGPHAWSADPMSSFDQTRTLLSSLLLAAAVVPAERMVREVTEGLAKPHASQALAARPDWATDFA